MAAGPLVGQAIPKHSTWRWVYYINIILTAVSGIMIVLFYHLVRFALPCQQGSAYAKDRLRDEALSFPGVDQAYCKELNILTGLALSY
jgi:MFS family permease